jgi:hypothetical protein
MTTEELYVHIKKLEDRIDTMQNEIDHLYHESVGTTNELYELHNRIDMMDSTPHYAPQPVVDSPKTVTFTAEDFI